jgi:hypothetical protein
MAAVDSAGVVLFQPLSEGNYAKWVQRMSLKLGSKGLLKVVLGQEEDKDKDEQALILIGQHVDDFHLDVVMHAAGGRAAWVALAAMHRGQSAQRLTDLRVQLNDFKKSPDESITACMGRARQLIGV